MTEAPAAPAGASAIMNDAPDLPVATPEAHAAAFARLEDTTATRSSAPCWPAAMRTRRRR